MDACLYSANRDYTEDLSQFLISDAPKKLKLRSLFVKSFHLIFLFGCSLHFKWKHPRAPKERVMERVLQEDDLILL